MAVLRHLNRLHPHECGAESGEDEPYHAFHARGGRLHIGRPGATANRGLDPSEVGSFTRPNLRPLDMGTTGRLRGIPCMAHAAEMVVRWAPRHLEPQGVDVVHERFHRISCFREGSAGESSEERSQICKVIEGKEEEPGSHGATTP